jgi:hypothetical protein
MGDDDLSSIREWYPMRFGARLRAKISAVAAEFRDGEVARPRWIAACVIVTRAIPSSLLHFRLLAITRARSVPAFQARVGVRYHRIKSEDFPTAFRARTGSYDPVYANVMRDLRHGSEVFVAERHERIVAYIMTAYQNHYIPEVRFLLPLRPDEACTTRAYVDPELRRYSGVYPGLASFVFSQVSGEGIHSLLGYAIMINRYSMRTHRRLGYEQVGWVGLLQLPFGSLQVSRLDSDGGRLRWRLLPPNRRRGNGRSAPDELVRAGSRMEHSVDEE